MIFISWLRQRRLLALVFLVIYYLSVVLPHKQFGAFLNKQVFNGITRDQYDLIVLLFALVGLIAYLFIFSKNVAKRPDRKTQWVYMSVNSGLAVLVINFLFVVNIEIIHFPQYALFALLLFPIIGNFNLTLFWTTMAGALDEGYQYFYLAPKDTSYYDFNDVVTNLIGGVFGLLLIRSLGIENFRSFRSGRLWIFGFLLIIAGLLIALHQVNILSIYPSDHHTYQILRAWPSGFWSKVHPNVIYHVMRPLEGVLIIAGLLIFYSKIDK